MFNTGMLIYQHSRGKTADCSQHAVYNKYVHGKFSATIDSQSSFPFREMILSSRRTLYWATLPKVPTPVLVTMETPANGPDQNPREPPWSTVQRKRRDIRTSNVDAIKLDFLNISAESELNSSMPRRTDAVIHAKRA
uniref:PPUP8762 n=1 Tax=Poeciliopsis prolifica TaxID=188132 RepID=A0A0S7EQ80_9TELE